VDTRLPMGLDAFLRSVTSALLALIVIGVSAYQVIVSGQIVGPFVNWGGIIIGVYVGGHLATQGADRRRAVDVANGKPPPPPSRP
jgi:hypothetical protein